MSISGLASPLALPNMAKLSKSGPNVVPKLLMPPAKLKRCEPVSGVPKRMVSGLATVCCKLKPIPTTIKPARSKANEPLLAAGMKSKVPKADTHKPMERALPKPISAIKSRLRMLLSNKYPKEPKV